MKFAYGYSTYRIRFQYKDDQDKLTRTVLRTFAFVEQLIDDGKWVQLPGASGTALCSSLDQFKPEVGRKLALTRAIHTFDKSFRSAVWHAYHGRKAQTAVA